MNPLIKKLTEEDANDFVPSPKQALDALPVSLHQEFNDLYAIWFPDEPDTPEDGDGSFVARGDVEQSGGIDPLLADSPDYLEAIARDEAFDGLGWKVVKVKVAVTRIP